MDQVCTAHQWSAGPFHRHVDDMVEAERECLPSALSLTDDEIRKSYLLMWLSLAVPAGKA